jgi:mycofactocin system creatininase family protein
LRSKIDVCENCDTRVAIVTDEPNFGTSMNSPEKNNFERSTIGARQVNSAYHHRVPVLGELGAATSGELLSTSLSLMIPLGSTEQHGPHLPLDTDTRIATAVAGAARASLEVDLDQVWSVAPPIAYGASGEHQSFPGTISIGTYALTMLLVEYGRSGACWARRLVFVNGHGGNTEALRRAVTTLRAEGRDVSWCPCATAGGDAHAGHTETSVLLHISPSDVLTDRWRAGNPAPLPELLPTLRTGGLAAVSPVGVLGDPTTATAAEGKRIFSEMVDGCVHRIRRWSPGPDGMLT